MRVLEYIKEANNYIETADGQRISAAQMLERFLFPPELQWVPVSKLSGGEKRRLYLLRVLMTAPNVLLLDEPTNDLDIPTLSVLEDYLDSFGFDEEKRERIAKATFQSPVWDERDRGLYDEENYVRQCQELAPEYAKDIAAVMRDTPKTVRRMPYAETWTKYLKSQGYQLYVLSNYSRYMLDRTKKEMPFLKYMDGTVFSCDVKQLKPEADIYQTLLDRFGLKAEECVFIDDRPVNCEGAQKAGIHTICFKSFKQAAAELEALGVK